MHAVFTLPRLLSRNREMFDRILEKSGAGEDITDTNNGNFDQKDDIADESVQNIEPTPSGSNETSYQKIKKEK